MRIVYITVVLLMVYSFPGWTQGVSYETEFLKLSLTTNGHFAELFDKLGGRDYLAKDKISSLLSIRVNGDFSQSEELIVADGNLILRFPKSNAKVEVTVKEHPTYLSFEIVSITSDEHIELVIWGPYQIAIDEIIGEAVGVVRNAEFALGIQALNAKTLGGFPSSESDVEPAYDIFETGTLVDVEKDWRKKKFYRGQTAKPVEGGSILQAYTRNRDQERIIENWGHTHFVAPAFDDGGIIGSKIAIFGSPSGKALQTIGEIELSEGLPHPLIGDEWAKTSPYATASYLITDFTEGNLDDALELVKKAGLKYLYHGHPFKSWGHFPLIEQSFPDNWESMKRAVERAKKEGIYLGVHTLSNFIHTHDPYVTPVPDPRLAKVGESMLTKPVGEEDEEIYIESPLFFNQMQNNSLKAVVIGNEIIRYRDVSASEPWHLTGCVRGAFGTQVSSHHQGTTIGKLMDHAYKVFLSNADLSAEIAITLANLFNETGLMQLSFDGLEGVWATGKGQYARSLFTKTWYDHLGPELKGRVINDASNPSHFNWHINTRYNWGEPWYAGFRESQTQYRLMNQDFYRRNLLPSMLGWFSMNAQTSIEDAEWLLARAAGFDAGFAFNLNLDQVAQNGSSDAIFNAINTWETARMAGAFRQDQKYRMENTDNEFHLEAIDKGRWNLYQFQIERFDHKQKIRQPGEPLHSVFEFENPHDDQPLMFMITLSPGEGENDASLEKITIELNDYSNLEIPVKMVQSNILKLDQSGKVTLYDRNWNLLETIEVARKLPVMEHGNNKITVDAAFLSDGFSTLKLELKTSSRPEEIEAIR